MIKTLQPIVCTHCGTPFRPKNDKEHYCCQGCHYVAQVINDGGLERFYELRGKQTLPPVGTKVFQNPDTAWLETVQTQAEGNKPADDQIINIQLHVEGISCIGCVWLIEAVFKDQPGHLNIRINTQSAMLNFNWSRGEFDLTAFASALQNIGYVLRPNAPKSSEAHEDHGLGARIGLCGFFLMNTMLFTLPSYLGMEKTFFLAAIFQLLAGCFATLSLLVGGGYFIQRASRALRARVMHIDLPIAAGIIVAYAGSFLGAIFQYDRLVYFDFVATFSFLMLLGRWLQEVTLKRNRSQAQNRQYGPKTVTLCSGSRDGEVISAESIKIENVYSIAPGAINPVAADLLDSHALLSLEWINGESEPVARNTAETIPAGSINVGKNPIRLCARESWADSLLAQLLEAPPSSFEDTRSQKAISLYITGVISVAVIGGFSWLALSHDILKSTQVLISVLIVSCPCALGIALPMCDDLAIARLRKIGLFIKSNEIWPRIRKIDTLVFDKTGTLTTEAPRLKNTEPIRRLSIEAYVALYILVAQNHHPIARSLREVLITHYPAIKTLHAPHEKHITETVGQGLQWIDPDGDQWSLGKSNWFANGPNTSTRKHHTSLRKNGIEIAHFDFEEDLRDDAFEAVQYFNTQQINIAILSGDKAEKVDSIAQQLMIAPAAVRSQCTPQEKAHWIRINAPESTLMIGDGANDSLAFDQAICRGTPIVDHSVLEARSDFFFFGRSLRSLPALFQVATQRNLIVNAIIVITVIYNLVAISLSLAGYMHPLLAAILMPLSSVISQIIAQIGLR